MHDPKAVAFDLSPVLTIWHKEPAGADSGTVCKGRWRWHVAHWRLQFPFLQRLRRRMLTKCEWCGGPSRPGDMVNVSRGWGDGPRTPWWQGQRGVYHSDCLSIDTAHRTCGCPEPELENPHAGYGNCLKCGLFRPWRSSSPDWAARNDLQMLTNAMLRAIPKGERAPGITDAVAIRWREFHATRKVG